MKLKLANFFGITLTSALISIGLPSAAQAITWDGGANTDNWSGNGSAGNNNWSPNGAPAANNDLVFAGTTRLTPNNNITGDVSYAGITFSNTAGAFTLGGNRITLGGNVTNNDADLQTINMDLILSANRIFDAASGNLAVGGIISGNFSVTKSGANSLSLGAANTFSGTTAVNAGSLYANNSSGSATGTGAVSVGSNGILGGSGTLTPTGANGINVTGVLAPGSGVGTTGNLTFNLASTTGTVTMNSGSSLQFDLGIAGSNINTTGISDLLSLAGASVSAFAFNGNSIDFLGTGGIGYYKLFDTSNDNANTWTGLTVNGSGVITSGLAVSNLSSGLSGNLIMGGNVLGGNAGDIYLQVVPEPFTPLFGGLGALLLLRRRRI